MWGFLFSKKNRQGRKKFEKKKCALSTSSFKLFVRVVLTEFEVFLRHDDHIAMIKLLSSSSSSSRNDCLVTQTQNSRKKKSSALSISSFFG